MLPGVTGEKKTRANGRASRKAILSVALEVFAERGYRGTSLAEIASRVGMTQPGLLHHFSTKEDLLLQVVREHEAVIARNMAGSLTKEPLDLRGAILILADMNEDQQPEQLLLSTLSSEAILPSHPLHGYFVQFYRESRRDLAKVLRRAQKSGIVRDDVDVRAVSAEIVATLDGLRLQWLLDPETSRLRQVLEAFADRISMDLAAGM